MNKSESLKAYCKEYGFELKKDTKISDVLKFLNSVSNNVHCETMRKGVTYKDEPGKPKIHRRHKIERVCEKCGQTFHVVSGLKRENAKMCIACSD